jgi:hypothetical protein
MAVCPKCASGVGLNADTCPKCGASLQLIPEPDRDPIQALKADIEDYVEETAPEDLALAGRQIDAWQPTTTGGPEEIVTSAEDARPVAAYGAPDETTAKLVASLLQNEGIDAAIDRVTIPMLDTAQNMEDGVWGYVMVHQVDLERTKEILRAYEDSSPDTSADV